MKERDSALKRALKSGHCSDQLTFTTLRKKVLRNLRKSKAEVFLYFIRIIIEAQGNGKLIRRNLNKLTGRNKEQRITLFELKVNGMTQDNNMMQVHLMISYELAQGIPTETIPTIPIDKAKPNLKIKEMSKSEVIKFTNSLRNSEAKIHMSWIPHF